MEIKEYDSKYRKDFIAFNTDWIQEHFGKVEKEDLDTFNNIEERIRNGGMAFFAVEEDVVLACCMAYPMGENVSITIPVKKDCNRVLDGTWELCKLASNKRVPHSGAGSAVFKKSMDYAISHGAKRLFILSNSSLKPAIHIYLKYGFKEITLKDYEYERGDIAFEYIV